MDADFDSHGHRGSLLRSLFSSVMEEARPSAGGRILGMGWGFGKSGEDLE